MYIREIKTVDEEEEDLLTVLHQLTFFDTAKRPRFDEGHWWLAYNGATAIGFAGMVQSVLYPNTGYFLRIGVIKAHTGCGLALRLMRAIERRAKANGWTRLVSDCTADNIPSANNFIRQGWRMFSPEAPWAFSHSLYWSKAL